MREVHGSGMSLRIYGASHGDDPRVQALWGRAERLSASPGAARALFEMLPDIDVRGVLPSVRVPCLVIHGTESTSAISDGEMDFGAASFASCCGPRVCPALLAGYDEMRSRIPHLAC